MKTTIARGGNSIYNNWKSQKDNPSKEILDEIRDIMKEDHAVGSIHWLQGFCDDEEDADLLLSQLGTKKKKSSYEDNVEIGDIVFMTSRANPYRSPTEFEIVEIVQKFHLYKVKNLDNGNIKTVERDQFDFISNSQMTRKTSIDESHLKEDKKRFEKIDDKANEIEKEIDELEKDDAKVKKKSMNPNSDLENYRKWVKENGYPVTSSSSIIVEYVKEKEINELQLRNILDGMGWKRGDSSYQILLDTFHTLKKSIKKSIKKSMKKDYYDDDEDDDNDEYNYELQSYRKEIINYVEQQKKYFKENFQHICDEYFGKGIVKILKVYLAGSYADNTMYEDSDVDLGFDYKGDVSESELAEQLAGVFDYNGSFFDVAPNQIKNIKHSIKKIAVSYMEGNAWVKTYIDFDELEDDDMIEDILNDDNSSTDEKQDMVIQRIQDILESRNYDSYIVQNVDSTNVHIDWQEVNKFIRNWEAMYKEEIYANKKSNKNMKKKNNMTDVENKILDRYVQNAMNFLKQPGVRLPESASNSMMDVCNEVYESMEDAGYAVNYSSIEKYLKEKYSNVLEDDMEKEFRTASKKASNNTLPGPGEIGSSCISLDDDEVDYFEEESSLRKLLYNDKVNLLDNELWYWDDDKSSKKILEGYFSLSEYEDINEDEDDDGANVSLGKKKAAFSNLVEDGRQLRNGDIVNRVSTNRDRDDGDKLKVIQEGSVPVLESLEEGQQSRFDIDAYDYYLVSAVEGKKKKAGWKEVGDSTEDLSDMRPLSSMRKQFPLGMIIEDFYGHKGEVFAHSTRDNAVAIKDPMFGNIWIPIQDIDYDAIDRDDAIRKNTPPSKRVLKSKLNKMSIKELSYDMYRDAIDGCEIIIEDINDVNGWLSEYGTVYIDWPNVISDGEILANLEAPQYAALLEDLVHQQFLNEGGYEGLGLGDLVGSKKKTSSKKKKTSLKEAGEDFKDAGTWKCLWKTIDKKDKPEGIIEDHFKLLKVGSLVKLSSGDDAIITSIDDLVCDVGFCEDESIATIPYNDIDYVADFDPVQSINPDSPLPILTGYCLDRLLTQYSHDISHERVFEVCSAASSTDKSKLIRLLDNVCALLGLEKLNWASEIEEVSPDTMDILLRDDMSKQSHPLDADISEEDAKLVAEDFWASNFDNLPPKLFLIDRLIDQGQFPIDDFEPALDNSIIVLKESLQKVKAQAYVKKIKLNKLSVYNKDNLGNVRNGEVDWAVTFSSTLNKHAEKTVFLTSKILNNQAQEIGEFQDNLGVKRSLCTYNINNLF